MPRRDLIRNVIIVGVLVLALILLRIFVFHPFSINDKMANASVKNGDLVVATRNAQVDRSDLVLYKVSGKEYLGRVIAKENDEVSYVDDVLYLNGQATPEPYLNKMLNKHLAAPTSNGYYTDDFFLSELKGTKAGRVPSDTYLVLMITVGIQKIVGNLGISIKIRSKELSISASTPSINLDL